MGPRQPPRKKMFTQRDLFASFAVVAPKKSVPDSAPPEPPSAPIGYTTILSDKPHNDALIIRITRVINR